MITATRREQGPATSCSKCNEGPIRGFNVVDTEHGIHSVMCADCAMEAVTDTDPDVESVPDITIKTATREEIERYLRLTAPGDDFTGLTMDHLRYWACVHMDGAA